MALFDSETMEKVGKSDWYSGTDFEGEGLTLQIKSVEKVKSQYGADENHKLVEKEVLEKGELFRYTFVDVEGNEKPFDSHSQPFMIAMNQAEFNMGDWLHITRTGKLKDTRYVAEKVDAPAVSPAKSEDNSDDTPRPEDIPF